MTLAHGSLGIMVAGITATSAWQSESIRMMRPGDVAELAGYEFKFEGVEAISGPNYTGVRGAFTVTEAGQPIARLTPEKRNYPAEGSSTTEAAIRTTVGGDLYTVLGDADGTGGWSTRIFHNPLVPWIWVGAALMALGGLISLTDRRHRIGAPRRASRAKSAGTDPAGKTLSA